MLVACRHCIAATSCQIRLCKSPRSKCACWTHPAVPCGSNGSPTADHTSMRLLPLQPRSALSLPVPRILQPSHAPGPCIRKWNCACKLSLALSSPRESASHAMEVAEKTVMYHCEQVYFEKQGHCFALIFMANIVEAVAICSTADTTVCT